MTKSSQKKPNSPVSNETQKTPKESNFQLAPDGSLEESNRILNLERRLMEMEHYTMATIPQRAVKRYYPDIAGGCGCGPKNCCCFDIYISRARVIKDQSGLPPIPLIDEPGDGDLGVLDVTNKQMELLLHATANGFSGLFPSLTSYIGISQSQGWVPVNKKITQVSVSGSKAVPVMVEVREVETMALGGRAEYGSSDVAYLNLACGCPSMPLVFPVSLTGGGNAGGIVEVEVTAIAVTCEGC